MYVVEITGHFGIGSFLHGTCIVVEKENDYLLQKH